MADTLSQSEIDSLLSAITTGELDAEEIRKEEMQTKIKLYDFQRPMKFSKDQIRNFQMIHENFARALSNYLSARLRFYVEVTLGPIDQITYGEFIKSLGNPTFISVFSSSNLQGSSILEINHSIIYTMIDRILGGPGNPLSKTRPLTEIELNIIRREVTQFLSSLKDAWSSVMSFRPEIENIESNPQFVQIAPPNEMTLLVTMEVSMGNLEGFMNVCWPTSVIEPFTEKMSNQLWFSNISKRDKTKVRAQLQKGLKSTGFPVSAVLGKTELTLADLLFLQVGDVVRLHQHREDPITVLVGNHPKFTGIPGTYRMHRAIRVTGLTENDSFDETGSDEEPLFEEGFEPEKEDEMI